ncbi:glycosyltransferase family 2 protein [Kribbella solani]|uniref:glycosyltransferase family 2 protein n=1 Tax=Kribbella solani TaxID=236067 RepID=UPI0029A515ED|nr:glycosyltransferase family 2 protein [Kribbella solani]MDX3001873.1 glycosyltransferase family 2 protein [Kribbella solani]
MFVDLVLPCLNEAAALPWILGRLPPDVRAVVVDNGSTDGSAEIAAGLGAAVVHCKVKGYGAACHAGLEAARAEVVAFMDADASLDPQQLMRVITPVLAGYADLVVGRRRPVSRRAWPWHLRLANAKLSRRIRRRTGVALHDLGPMRAARRQPLLNLAIADRRSGYPLETVVRAADAGWRIVEIDVDYLPRSGRSKVTGTPLGAARAVLDMSKVLTGPTTPVLKAQAWRAAARKTPARLSRVWLSRVWLSRVWKGRGR